MVSSPPLPKWKEWNVMNRKNGVTWRITPLLGTATQLYCKDRKKKKYNLDGVADALHHISPLFKGGLGPGRRNLAVCLQSDRRILVFFCLRWVCWAAQCRTANGRERGEEGCVRAGLKFKDSFPSFSTSLGCSQTVPTWAQWAIAVNSLSQHLPAEIKRVTESIKIMNNYVYQHDNTHSSAYSWRIIFKGIIRNDKVKFYGQTQEWFGSFYCVEQGNNLHIHIQNVQENKHNYIVTGCCVAILLLLTTSIHPSIHPPVSHEELSLQGCSASTCVRRLKKKSSPW